MLRTERARRTRTLGMRRRGAALNSIWRLVLVGPADLERSIVDSALRQAGFELAVPNHFVDLQGALAVDGVHGVLVVGDHLGRESEKIDLESDIIRPANRLGISVMLLVDHATTDLGEGVSAIERPLRFPAAASQIATTIENFQQSSLSRSSSLAKGSLRHDIARAASSLFSGVMVIDAPEAPGQIHMRGGEMGLVVCGGLTGAEALCVLLSLQEGSYRFDRQQVPQGESLRSSASFIAEADALELRTAEMMARAPDGGLDADPERLLQRLNLLSDDVAWIFRLVDGKRDIKSLWSLGGSRAIEGALSLIEDGILIANRGSSRVVGLAIDASLQAPQIDSVEPSKEDSLEDDFAWSLAVKGVSGLSGASLKEEGWSEVDRDWDQLPDLDLGIEDALSAAQTYFKTKAPEYTVDNQPELEPLLAVDEPPVVDATGEFEPPPVLDDADLFIDQGEPPPIIDDDLDDDLPPVDRSFDADLTPYEPPKASSTPPKNPYRAMGTGTFGHDDQITSTSEGDDRLDYETSTHRALKRLRTAAIGIVIFGLGAYSAYSYSKRFQKPAKGVYSPVESPKTPARDGFPVEPAQNQPPEPQPAVKKPQPRKKAKRRRRRRRRVRRSNRSRLQRGDFAKKMQGARMLRDDGNLDGAVELISVALKQKISSAERSIALSERGEAYFSAGSPNKARSDLRSAIAADSSNAFALKTLGLIEYQSFKSGDEGARARARALLVKYKAVAGRPDAAVERWLAELE